MTIGPVMSCFLDEMVKKESSDMYLTVGCKPSVRLNHNIIPISDSPLQPHDIQRFIDELLSDEQKVEYAEKLELNISITRDDGTRYRANFFRQKEYDGMVVRRIAMNIPTIEELGLPEVYTKAIMKRSGLVIMASPGGSGKSTSMAAMLGYRNQHGSGHIVTIEDPIEFVHKHGNCIITQREVGTDTHSYGLALKNALRQRADVIAIGEIRDQDTLEHAIRFAETGHLCVATLHSNNAYQAITRMVNLFPDDARNYVLATIAQNLVAVFSQRLVMARDSDLRVVSEILLNEGLITTLMTDDRLNEIKEHMERSAGSGMQTFDQALYTLFEQGVIEANVAIAEADNPATVKLKITQSRQDMSGINMNMLDDKVF